MEISDVVKKLNSVQKDLERMEKKDVSLRKKLQGFTDRHCIDLTPKEIYERGLECIAEYTYVTDEQYSQIEQMYRENETLILLLRGISDYFENLQYELEDMVRKE
jgi:hypothetical protein